MLETYVSRDLEVESKSEIFRGMDFRGYFALITAHSMNVKNSSREAIIYYVAIFMLDVMITKFKGHTKADLERIIKEHGGKYFQHPDASPKIRIIADSISTYTHSLIFMFIVFFA